MGFKAYFLKFDSPRRLYNYTTLEDFCTWSIVVLNIWDEPSPTLFPRKELNKQNNQILLSLVNFIKHCSLESVCTGY